MDPRHNLDEAVRHLIRHFNKLSDDIEFEENRSRLKRHHPLHLDPTGIKAFSILEGQVTLHCLQLLKTAWSKACSESYDIIELPCTGCSLVLQYHLPCQHYLRPFAILKEPIPLYLIHPRWHIDQQSWDATGNWNMPITPLQEPDNVMTQTSASFDILDHQGQQQSVEAAYEMEAHLEQQPAHIAAQRAHEFQETTAALRRRWIETQEESHNTVQVLPTPPVSFRTQFRTSTKNNTSKRGLTGAELAENELQRQQAIDHIDHIEPAAENETQETQDVNETQDAIVVRP